MSRLLDGEDLVFCLQGGVEEWTYRSLVCVATIVLYYREFFHNSDSVSDSTLAICGVLASSRSFDCEVSRLAMSTNEGLPGPFFGGGPEGPSPEGVGCRPL